MHWTDSKSKLQIGRISRTSLRTDGTHTTHVDGFFTDQTGRLNPSGQPHAIEGQGGAGAPLLKRARCWFTALELTPDDGPRESEETNDDAAPSGYWQYGGELTTPDPTAWSVNGWPTLTLAKRTPLLFADNKAIYLALISRHFRNKNPGKPWSPTQGSSASPACSAPDRARIGDHW